MAAPLSAWTEAFDSPEVRDYFHRHFSGAPKTDAEMAHLRGFVRRYHTGDDALIREIEEDQRRHKSGNA